MEHPALKHTDHRPWQMPGGRWIWRQSWCDLLFAHWRVPATELRPLIPAPLELEERGGVAWIGVVPFRMEGVMRRPLPDVPGLSAFPELNVRTYVTLDGKPGVWFFSLDATNPIAVWAARRFFHLPYHRAEIVIREHDGWFEYRSRRLDDGASFEARYRPRSPAREARAGSLEHWLTERYCLYARAPSGALWRTEVHHPPWPLQDAEVDIASNTLLRGLIELPAEEPLVHFARRLDVVVWPAQRAQGR